LLFVLNACYHVCLEGANLAKIMILEIEKLKIDLDSTTGEEWMLL
jgi:hypothetical protein